MASAVYPEILESFATKAVSWTADDVIVILLSSAYTYDPAHVFVSELAGEVARSGPLSGKSAALGVLDAADVTFTALTGAAVTQFVLAFDLGADSASPLIAKLDNADYTGLPLTPDGTDVPLIWPNDGNKIMVL